MTTKEKNYIHLVWRKEVGFLPASVCKGKTLILYHVFPSWAWQVYKARIRLRENVETRFDLFRNYSYDSRLGNFSNWKDSFL